MFSLSWKGQGAGKETRASGQTLHSSGAIWILLWNTGQCLHWGLWEFIHLVYMCFVGEGLGTCPLGECCGGTACIWATEANQPVSPYATALRAVSVFSAGLSGHWAARGVPCHILCLWFPWTESLSTVSASTVSWDSIPIPNSTFFSVLYALFNNKK